MTILFYSPSNSVGGAELSLLHTMHYLRTNGVKVVLAMPLANDLSYYFMAKKVANSIYYVKGMNWISSKDKGIQKWKNWAYSAVQSGGWHIVPVLKLAKIILQERVDLVHTNTLVCIDAAFAAKITRRPHVQHIREITGIKKEALFKLKFQGTLFFRKLYSMLNGIILCNSYYTLRESEMYFPKEKLKVIYNSIKLPEVLPEAYNNGVMQVCIMANLTSRNKNHLLALQVAKFLKEAGNGALFKFNLFGKLPHEGDRYLKSLIKYIDEHKLQSIVEIKGFDVTHNILESNHVLFHTYSSESFGRVFIEAMSYGRPIISVKGGGASELIEDGTHGFLVDSEDPSLIAECLVKLLKDTKRYHLIRQNCINKSKCFVEDIVYPKLIEAYNKLINTEL